MSRMLMHRILDPAVQLRLAAHPCHSRDKGDKVRCGQLWRLVREGKRGVRMTCLQGHVSRGRARELAN